MHLVKMAKFSSPILTRSLRVALKLTVHSSATIEPLRDEAWRILYNTTIQKTPSLALWPVTIQAEELKLEMRKQAEQTQKNWLSYVDNLTKAEQQGKLALQSSANEVATALGLTQSAPDTFAPVAQPSDFPGVPMWLLMLRSRGAGSGKPDGKMPGSGQKGIELQASPKDIMLRRQKWASISDERSGQNESEMQKEVYVYAQSGNPMK